MFGPRMLLGAVVGGTLVYFFDPQNGARRRQRMREWWEENELGDRVNQAGERVGEKVNEKVNELGARVRGDAEIHEVPVP